MRNADSVAFGRALGKTAEAFGESISTARIVIYFEELADLPLETVLAALTRARSTLKFFPKIAEVREIALGNPGDHALLAWSRVLQAVETLGTGESVNFQDEALHAAVEAMGGWPDMDLLERLEPRELNFRRLEFTRLYLAFAASPPARVAPILWGRYQMQNSLTQGAWTRGLDYEVPVHLLSARSRMAVATRQRAELKAPESDQPPAGGN